jgi:hypothetical protein
VLDQVEDEQQRLLTPASAPQRMEVRHPLSRGDYDLAVDQERLRLEASGGINDGREVVVTVLSSTISRIARNSEEASHTRKNLLKLACAS